MEVPQAYAMDMIQKMFDSRIDALEGKITSYHTITRTDILELKETFKEFKSACDLGMRAMDKRVRDYETFKVKLIAYSFVIATVAGFATRIIFE